MTYCLHQMQKWKMYGFFTNAEIILRKGRKSQPFQAATKQLFWVLMTVPEAQLKHLHSVPPDCREGASSRYGRGLSCYNTESLTVDHSE